MGVAHCLVSYIDRVGSVGAMCSMLVWGVVLVNVLSEVGLGSLCFLISLCVLCTLHQFGKRILELGTCRSWMS